MKVYYALDYVDDEYCELVVDGQLYETQEAAAAAKIQKSNPNLYEINFYTILDLKQIFEEPFEINSNLVVCEL